MDLPYIVTKNGTKDIIKCANLLEAESEAEKWANKEREATAIYSFKANVEPQQEVNELLSNSDKANKYLKSKYPIDYTDRASFFIAKKYILKLSALYELTIIADAWNDADGFVPDFKDLNQEKWYVCMRLDAENRLVIRESRQTRTMPILGLGLFFKSEKRANQFGQQFFDLFKAYFGMYEPAEA
jgi:hypothetical protein